MRELIGDLEKAGFIDRGVQEMTKGDKYLKIVEWSDEDDCFIGSCPELFYGGCHGSDPKSVFAELCEIIEETILLYEQDERPLPPAISGRDLVNSLQKIA